MSDLNQIEFSRYSIRLDSEMGYILSIRKEKNRPVGPELL